jgi:FMN phosphatase YigB (HAD superfamily)
MQSLDTNFSISNGVLYMDLVELKEKGLPMPDYKAIAEDVKEMIDLAHRDGSLKKEVQKNLATYIIQDPETVDMLERLRRYQKKLLLITNSDFEYTKLLLDYAVTPFLKDCGHWNELFDIVITFSMKPRFFTEKSSFLEIDLQSGKMSNHVGPVLRGIFQGGNAQQLQKDLGLTGDEILYIGDHIYGDVVSIKKTFNWRTALVLEQLHEEMQGLQKGAQVQLNIDDLMEKKSKIELQLNHLYTEEYELKKPVNKKQVDDLFDEIEKLNAATSNYIVEYQKGFNKNWGELMRAGQEESRFAGQVEKYACLYMIKISDLMTYSPRSYFRPLRRVLPHERGFLSWN